MQSKRYLLTVLVVSLLGFTQNVPDLSSRQGIFRPVGTQFSMNNGAGISDAVSDYDWSQTDAGGSVGNLIAAGPGKTLTLTPCPLGVDVSNNVNAQYGVYISGVGAAEAVPVTGGTCTSGGPSGTIIVTTRNPHRAGFTVSSANGGNQEAINAATLGGSGHAIVKEVTTGGANSADYKIYWPVFLKSGKSLLDGTGAEWTCYTRVACLMVGDYRGSTGSYSVVRGLELRSALNVTGAHVVSVSASAGNYTITTSTVHNLLVGDYAIIYYSTPAATQEARVFISSVPSSTQFTYKLGSATFPLSRGFGTVIVENAGIEIVTQGVRLEDVKFAGGLSGGRFHQGVVVGNDQRFIIDGVTNEGSGQVLRCDTNFCGNLVYLRGDQGAAPVGYLHNFEASLQCGGNGVRNVAGNTLSISDSVIQGTAQYSIYYAGGQQPWQISNVYNETGNCTNPFYPAALSGIAGIIENGSNSALDITGDAPIGGSFPTFATGGSPTTQRNYYVVPKDSNLGTGPMMFIGDARPRTSGTRIPLYWPNPALNGAGTRTFDILVTIGNVQTSAPYTGNAFSIVTGISGNCNTSGICTYTDSQAATSAYTVANALWVPTLPFWPGSIILGGGASVYMNQCGQASSIISTSYLPKVFCKRGVIAGNTNSYTPYWGVYSSGDSSGNGNKYVGAQVMQIGPASGTWNSGISGALNFNPGPGDSVSPRQIITTLDGTPQLTFATPGYVRTSSAKDSFIGTDTTGSVGTQDQTYGAPGGHNFYVKDKGTSGTTWALHIGASGPQVKSSKYSDLNAATPCSPGTEGSVAAVTDSNTASWGAAIAGGGSSHVLAYCDGTHWTVAAR